MICRAPMPTIEGLFYDYYTPIKLVGKRPRTIKTYKMIVGRWNCYKQTVPIDSIGSAEIAGFQAFVLQTCGPATANSYCRHLMAMLRFAADEDVGLLDRPPKCSKLKEHKNSPLALTVEEFSKVLATAREWPGEIAGYPASVWWTALLLVCWETGLRYTALLLLRSIDMLFDSAGLLCQADTQKDKEAMWFDLPPHVLDAVQAIHDPTRELLFPRDVTIETVGKWFRVILDNSGIYAPKGSGMRFHRIRKSKASYTEANGGDAQKALGHSARSVTERYLDPRIVGRAKQPPMPSPLLYASEKPRFRVYG